MGRRYGPEEVEAAAALLRSARDDPFLACDVIAGFPGETGADFEKTAELCERVGFAWIHAFPFSRRPGTRAWSFGDRVSAAEAGKRVRHLAALALRERRKYVRRWIHRKVEAVVEGGDGNNSRFVRATSDNYLKLLLSDGGGLPPPGSSLLCRITAPAEEGDLPDRPPCSGFDAMAVKEV
jgi:threonylcarbamoyladenosine tRNA methylthiotransferase MtaB